MKLNKGTTTVKGTSPSPSQARGVLSGDDFANFARASGAVRAQLGIDRLDKVRGAEVHAAVAKHQARQARKGVSSDALLTWRFAVCRKMSVEVANDPALRKSKGRNFILRMQCAKREKFAIRVGMAYHDRVKDLFSSRRATVAYGEGGQEGVDYDAYAKSYGFAAHWKNAGARIEGQGPWEIVLETSRGKEMARVAIKDFNAASKWLTSHPALLDGDLYAVPRHGVLERYGMRNGIIVKVGVAVQFTRLGTIGAVQDGQKRTLSPEWEHGETLGACRAENGRKIAIRDAAWTQYENRASFAFAEKAKREKMNRAARLIAKIVNKLPVGYDDARATGHCDAGIRIWCEKRGIDPKGTITLAELRKNATDTASQRVIEHVAERCAALLLAS